MGARSGAPGQTWWSPPDAPTGVPVARGKILVVDDEPSVLRLVVWMLEGAGYDTVSAPGSMQALEIFQAQPHIDLVVSDVVMPGMHGPQLMKEIKRLSPSIPVMLISGCVPERELPPDVPFVAKPFSPRQLLATVERVLQESAGTRREPRPVRREGEMPRIRNDAA
ncbi:MAG: response regulator [Bryobacteraceae bacterium]